MATALLSPDGKLSDLTLPAAAAVPSPPNPLFRSGLNALLCDGANLEVWLILSQSIAAPVLLNSFVKMGTWTVTGVTGPRGVTTPNPRPS